MYGIIVLTTSIVTVALSQLPCRLHNSYTKVSVPVKPVLGRYSIEPSRFTITVPLAGFATTLGVVAPFKVSLASTFTTIGVLSGVVARSSTAIGAIVGVGVAAGTVICTVVVAQVVGVATVQI